MITDYDNILSKISNNALSKNDVDYINNKIGKSDYAKNDDLLILTDIEGKARDLLTILKSAGVINDIALLKDNKISFEINPDYCGTIVFCGDMTSFKCSETTEENELTVGIFNELLEKIKKHNDKNSDKKITFAAVPGNHEFFKFCGQDLYKLTTFAGVVKEEEVLKNIEVKYKAINVIAKIQKYYLDCMKEKGEDIKDDDCKNLNFDIDETIKKLEEEIGKKIDNDVLCKKKEEIEQAYKDEDMEILTDDWSESKLIPSLIVNYKGMKNRIMHHPNFFIDENFNNNSDIADLKFNPTPDAVGNHNFMPLKQDGNDIYNILLGNKENTLYDLLKKLSIPAIYGHEGSKYKNQNNDNEKNFCADSNAVEEDEVTLLIAKVNDGLLEIQIINSTNDTCYRKLFLYNGTDKKKCGEAEKKNSEAIENKNYDDWGEMRVVDNMSDIVCGGNDIFEQEESNNYKESSIQEEEYKKTQGWFFEDFLNKNKKITKKQQKSTYYFDKTKDKKYNKKQPQTSKNHNVKKTKKMDIKKKNNKILSKNKYCYALKKIKQLEMDINNKKNQHKVGYGKILETGNKGRILQYKPDISSIKHKKHFPEYNKTTIGSHRYY